MTDLEVYLHEDRIGTLSRQEQARLEFRYEPAWVAKDGEPLSCALPVRPEPFDDTECRPFFAGLLPEGRFLRDVARAFHVSGGNAFAVLNEIGGECAGAVSLVPPGDEPPFASSRRPKWLSEGELATLVKELPDRPLLADSEDGIRLSLAGTQEKLPLLREDGRTGVTWGNPPSTHIIKAPSKRFEDMVANEAFCMALAKRCDLPTADAVPASAGASEYLLVTRYDRETRDGEIHRLHQEDFCQALGYLPEEKYQGDGGPDIAQCAMLLRARSAAPAVDVLRFRDALIFNLLIGNHDAHSKNYSLLLDGPSTPSLAPLYDLISTNAYEGLDRKIAMKVGGENRPDYIKGRHLARLAEDLGTAVPRLRDRIFELASRAVEVSPDTRTDLPDRWAKRPIVDKIIGLIDRNAERLGKAAEELA